MKSIFYLIVLLPFYAIPQENGIYFTKAGSWQEILTQASKENKYIFIDCYATWCGPCKLMDEKVYVDEPVGKLANSKFISIKLQMDSSKLDPEYIKLRYPIAHMILGKYRISSLPSYLFFSSKGKLLHRDLGAKSINAFIELLENALDTSKQYYTLLQKYISKQPVSGYSLMYLARLSKSINNDSLALVIAKDVKSNYLSSLSDSEYCKKENFDFIDMFPSIISSDDKIFKLCYYSPNLVNTVMSNKFYSSSHIKYVIGKEEGLSRITAAKEQQRTPSWKEMKKSIRGRFGNGYESIVYDYAVKWYAQAKDWKNTVKYSIEKVEKFGFDSSGFGRLFNVNGVVYNVIFFHSTKKRELKMAIGWMKVLLIDTSKNISATPSYIDTYANLLYKVGNVTEAIGWEEKARNLEYENALNGKRKPDKTFDITLNKMKEGSPTWK